MEYLCFVKRVLTTGKCLQGRYVLLKSRKPLSVSLCIYYRLWVHEVLRVFYDRLIDDKDRECLFNEIRKAVNANFQETFDVVLNDLSSSAVCNHNY